MLKPSVDMFNPISLSFCVSMRNPFPVLMLNAAIGVSPLPICSSESPNAPPDVVAAFVTSKPIFLSSVI